MKLSQRLFVLYTGIKNGGTLKMEKIKPRGIYGDGKAYERILEVLKIIPLGEKLFEKKLTF